jgi:hypothetical protein
MPRFVLTAGSAGLPVAAALRPLCGAPRLTAAVRATYVALTP